MVHKYLIDIIVKRLKEIFISQCMTELVTRLKKYFLYDVALLMLRKSLTFLQNYTALLFSLGETNVCQLVTFQKIWQRAVDKEKIDQ